MNATELDLLSLLATAVLVLGAALYWKARTR